MTRGLTNAAIAAIALGLPAAACSPAATAQETVTITLSNVNEAKGVVRVDLCETGKGQYPGACGAYHGSAAAQKGETTVSIPGVAPGTYAIQIVHDANNDGALNFPAEGYAYGNDAPFPPAFAAASIKVAGPTSTRARMNYGPSATASADPMLVVTYAGVARMGSPGAPPAPGVTKTDVRENGIYAEFYAPTGQTSLPALIMLGGSEGGINSPSRMAQSFTRQGYAVLALAYFAEVGLPRQLEGVPLEYFDKALGWLKSRPEINAAKIGVIGGSRGSEAALLLASRNKDVKAVLAFAPSGLMVGGVDMMDPGKTEAAWTLGGKELPFVTPDAANFRSKGMTIDVFMPSLTARPGAEIAVETINGPVLFLSGDDDKVWPSTPLANRMTARLKAKGFSHSVQHVNYPGVGHMVFLGDPALLPPNSVGVQTGGTVEANTKALADTWPKVLKFFDEALKGK